MPGRYERVSTHDADTSAHSDDDSSVSPTSRSRAQQTPRPPRPPHSPPPSFHSRACSAERRRTAPPVDATLADAFGSDRDSDENDDSDSEADDRQRLVRPSIPSRRSTQWPSPSIPSIPSVPSLSHVNANVNVNANVDSRSSTYSHQRPTPGPTSGSVYGGGIQSDGVFSNMTARPDANSEKPVEELPPTYEQAAADAAPPYWETTILAPGLAGSDEVYIDGMPVGSIFSFVWNGMISMSFQFVGFLLTYLLHSTHAAKNGSRAGLGITLIQYGFYMKAPGGAGDPHSGADGATGDGYAQPSDPNAHDFDPASVSVSGDGRDGGDGGSGSGGGFAHIAGSEWIAYVLMIVGWFILIRSVSDYIKARRHELLVLQSPDRGLGVPIIAEGETVETVV